MASYSRYCSVLFSLFFCVSIYGINEQLPRGRGSSRFGCSLTKPFSMLGAGLAWPFKKIGAALAEGAQEKLLGNFRTTEDNPLPHVPLGGAPPDLVESTMRRAVTAFFMQLSKETDPKNKAAGSAVIHNMLNSAAITVADLYNPEGEGRKALENLFLSFKAFMAKDGVIQETVREARLLVFNEFVEILKDIERLNQHEGEARDALHAVAENVSQGVDKVGQSVDTATRKIVRNVLIGTVLGMTTWFLWRHFERKLIKPKLALESSYKSLFAQVGDYFWGVAPHELSPMIFSEALKNRLMGIAMAARIITQKIQEGQTQMRYRNLLLWGQPGTGKTMFARFLSYYSGMDYVIISGASFAQYTQGEAIKEMNALFEWAQSSPKGLIVFIDEADAFLSKRSDQEVTQESYQLLTHFLHLTGERSNKLMFVFATNRPMAFDEALKRRIDDSVEIKLPELNERFAILKLYRDRYLLPNATAPFQKSVDSSFNDETLQSIALLSEGLSGGELEGIINTLISEVAIAADGLLTKEMLNEVVRHALEKHASFTKGFKGPQEGA